MPHFGQNSRPGESDPYVGYKVVTTHMEYPGPNPVNWRHLMTIIGIKRPDLGLFGGLKAARLLMKWTFGGPKDPKMGQ